jgi:hypothetical protein
MLKVILKKYTPENIWAWLSFIKKKLKCFKVKIFIILRSHNSIFLNGLVKGYCKKIVWLDTLKPEIVFLQAEDSCIYEPSYEGVKKKINVPKPKIALYKLTDCILHGESSHVILNDVVVMERLPHVPLEYCNYSTGLIQGYNNKYAVCQTVTDIMHVDTAFFLGGNGSWNYYHWTVEIFSKLKYFLHSKVSELKIKIILPDHARKTKSFSMMLDLFLHGNYEFVYIPNNKQIKVKTLYLINTPSNVVFNSNKVLEFESHFLFFDKKSLDFIRNTVLNSPQYISFLDTIKSKKIKNKVYIARKIGSARGYNQNKVVEVVKKYEFESIHIEDLSFFEQIHLFQNVDFIIGASGAAWTNLIYIKKGSKAISWLGENIPVFSGYSTLASYYECDLNFFKCKVENINKAHSDYVVDLCLLEKTIKKSLGFNLNGLKICDSNLCLK